jgi:hypothetical protein
MPNVLNRLLNNLNWIFYRSNKIRVDIIKFLPCLLIRWVYHKPIIWLMKMMPCYIFGMMWRHEYYNNLILKNLIQQIIMNKLWKKNQGYIYIRYSFLYIYNISSYRLNILHFIFFQLPDSIILDHNHNNHHTNNDFLSTLIFLFNNMCLSISFPNF